jgi:hypothetical protein
VLKEILSGEATEAVVKKVHELLTVLGETVRSGSVPLEEFIIFKVCLQSPTSADCKLLTGPSDLERTPKTTLTRNPNPTSRSLSA